MCWRVLLFRLARLHVALGLRLARLHLDAGDVGLREVLDVAGRVVDLRDLQGVDDQAHLLHVAAGRLRRLLRQRLAVADELLDGEPADDPADVPREDLRDPLAHRVRVVQEPLGRVRDRRVVGPDLERDDAAETDRDALRGVAVDVRDQLVEVEPELTGRLDHRPDEHALAGRDDPVLLHLVGALASLAALARDDERLVRLGDLEPP